VKFVRQSCHVMSCHVQSEWGDPGSQGHLSLTSGIWGTGVGGGGLGCRPTVEFPFLSRPDQWILLTKIKRPAYITISNCAVSYHL
jgi:hypothetical protein